MFVITPASAADVPAAAAVLASAFSDDPVMGAFVSGRDAHRRLETVFRVLLRSGALRDGRVDLAPREPGGEILGATIWERPGQSPSLLLLARSMPALVGVLGVRGLVAGVRLGSTLARFRPAEPHWHLTHIGVGPGGRGRGVGSALLSSRLARIDDENAAAYLESSNERNRALYRRHGFATIALITGVSGAAPAAMWRSPSSVREPRQDGALSTPPSS
ncbi:Acetyltransferase (GNAT) family protein [Rathayibacter oskolensis]|uniref:Acetyltransferase (GNAT) family protein n=1 Tax=Rathayibacter oskolensis TaxID=1891671 RepID=A0A1X7PJE4_9MICO|nr:GNAT family N-acetyltransferase [Rathayibacter oskolensis]SMH51043.1 Acetyltransferase (GNAT) family protein [Rathayibacter oskolensis]